MITPITKIGAFTYDNYKLGDESKYHKGLNGLIERHVIWLKKDRSGIKKVGVQALKIIECVALAIIPGGIFVFDKGIIYAKLLKKFDEFNKIKKSNIEPPPYPIVKYKTDKTSFNHINYYAIHNDQLWYKPINEPQAKWEMFYFDGLAKGSKPVRISVDGANLTVEDNQQRIHYKKVLKEKRLNKKLFKDVANEKYQYLDKTIKNNWKDKWFTLPYINVFFNAIKQIRYDNKLLKLDDDIISWSISHRGQFNRHYEDLTGTPQPISIGVTTLYAIYKGSNDVYFADPWLPSDFNRKASDKGFGLSHRIDGPKNPNYQAEKIDTSASTICMTGYEETAAGRKLKIYTILSDFDSAAHNPFLKYTDDPAKAVENKVRYRKQPDWLLQPDLPAGAVPLQGEKATISQNGIGNAAREIRMPALDPTGGKGYYWKPIYADAWQFKSDTE